MTARVGATAGRRHPNHNLIAVVTRLGWPATLHTPYTSAQAIGAHPTATATTTFPQGRSTVGCHSSAFVARPCTPQRRVPYRLPQCSMCACVCTCMCLGVVWPRRGSHVRTCHGPRTLQGDYSPDGYEQSRWRAMCLPRMKKGPGLTASFLSLSLPPSPLSLYLSLLPTPSPLPPPSPPPPPRVPALPAFANHRPVARPRLSCPPTRLST